MRQTSRAKRLGGRESATSVDGKDCASSAKWMILFERIPSRNFCVFPNDCNHVRRESHSSRCVRVALLGGSLIRVKGVYAASALVCKRAERAVREASSSRARMR